MRKTIDLQAIHDKTIERDDCWIWSGGDNGAGQPKIHGRSGRRVTWEAAFGERLRKTTQITVICGNPMCLNPDHLKKTTKGEITRINNEVATSKMGRKINGAKTNRQKFGKINMEIAHEIRASSECGKTLADRLGVSDSLIWNVRHGRSWVDHTSPFAGLLS